MCRDAAAVLELHAFIGAQAPDGTLEWNDRVRDCAFMAWRRIEPKSLIGLLPERWNEMQAAGFRLLTALPCTPASLKLPAHSSDCPCEQSWMGDDRNGGGCLRCPFYHVAARARMRPDWMASQHKQDWERRHAALACGERPLLWTDEEVRGDVSATRDMTSGARGQGYIEGGERPVHTWNPAKYCRHAEVAIPSLRSRFAHSLLAKGCPRLADLIDTNCNEFESLTDWAEDEGKLAADGELKPNSDSLIREWRLSSDYRDFLVAEEYGYDDPTRDR